MPSDVLSLDPLLAVGFIGALIVAVGFVMNQLGIWKAKDFEYDFINLIGGGIMAFYAYQVNDWPVLALFFVWFLLSLKDCLFDYWHRFDWKKKRRKNSKKNDGRKIV